MLCERGVSVTHTHRSTSRFLLDLQVVPAIKEISHLPVIVDPSHATFEAMGEGYDTIVSPLVQMELCSRFIQIQKFCCRPTSTHIV